MTNELRMGMSAVRTVIDGAVARVNPPQPAVTVPGNVRAFPTTVTQCRVCISPRRVQIERMLAEGMSYAAVANVINVEMDEESEHFISPRSIARHFKRDHMPLQAAALHRIVEHRARELGKELEETVDSVVDQFVVGRAMLQSYYVRLANNEVAVSSSDAVSLINAFMRIDSSVMGGIDASAYNRVVQIMIENMEQVVGPEKTREVLFLTSENPTVRAVMAQREAAIEASVS